MHNYAISTWMFTRPLLTEISATNTIKRVRRKNIKIILQLMIFWNHQVISTKHISYHNNYFHASQMKYKEYDFNSTRNSKSMMDIFMTLRERVSPRAIWCVQFLKLDVAQLLSITRQASQYKNRVECWYFRLVIWKLNESDVVTSSFFFIEVHRHVDNQAEWWRNVEVH